MEYVITFNKTFQERLQEYTDILGGYEFLYISQIKEEFALFLDVTIDFNGWQAIWKISRSTCLNLNIEFPTLALVYVESICFRELTAIVSILKVQEEVEVAKKHCVPLIQLYPTEKQDESIGLNLLQTANAIDMLRFFYTHLLMPWDDDSYENWFNEHLESRLHLLYDLRNGTIPKDMAANINGLLTEARHIDKKQQQLTEIIDKVNLDLKQQSKEMQQVLEMKIRMMQIQNELQLFTNPLLRRYIISQAAEKEVIKESNQLTYWMVFEQRKITEVLSSLCQIRSDVENVEVKFQSNFATTLEEAKVNDKIFVYDEKYVFNNLGDLQEGGSIIGCNKRLPILSSINEDIILDCQGELLLENLYIDVGTAQCGILVRSGTVSMKNCTIVGDYESSTQQGIIVLSGGTLKVEDCTLKGFFNAIVVNSGANLTMYNSIIDGVNYGLKFYDKSKVEIHSTAYRNCKKYGIFVERENCDMNMIGHFDTLLGIEEIEIQNLSGENNGKGNVKINKKCQLEPISDLFSNPELDPTIIHDDDNEEEEVDEENDEEMDVSGSNSVLDITAIDMNQTV
ncbi:hypothetical protein FQR65_LT05868 [Abscondita terminalis]|nr:hypothetical protein FQR65_LT05868 [Abscondita terminalis]